MRHAGEAILLSSGRLSGLPDQLFHNNHDGTFTDVSESSGIGRHIGKGRGLPSPIWMATA